MRVVFPQLLQFSDVGLLCLRLMVAVVFFESGRRHAGDPVGRAASIGLSPGFTRMLGGAEMAAAFGVALGVFTQVAALGLMLVMLGAIQKKLFVWHIGFWGDKIAIRTQPPLSTDNTTGGVAGFNAPEGTRHAAELR